MSPVVGLMTLRDLPASNINNTQRLQLLQRAFTVQSNIGVSTSFVQVHCTKSKNLFPLQTLFDNFLLKIQASLEVFDTLDPVSDDEVNTNITLLYSYHVIHKLYRLMLLIMSLSFPCWMR